MININIQQRFEAQDIANSGWNYKSNSSFITLLSGLNLV